MLGRAFYNRDPVEVARDLIGCHLVSADTAPSIVGRIVETEAYGGQNEDPASHAFRGPRPRNKAMFGPPGHLYVYRSHGIHFCANVVTEAEGVATAVLLRAFEPVAGMELMRQRRGDVSDRILCGGPGRICQAFGLTLSDDGRDLVGGSLLIKAGEPVLRIVATPRVGISVGADRLWRFVDADSSFLSRPVRRTLLDS